MDKGPYATVVDRSIAMCHFASHFKLAMKRQMAGI